MAKDEILLKLELEQSKAKVQIKKLKADISDMDKRTVEYKNKVLQLESAQIKLANANIKVAQRNRELSASYSNLNKNLDGSTKSTGAASSAALELGRVVSDMPYGIRGVANNLQQFASNMFFMANTTDQATGKTVGFMGALKNLGRSLIGPMGILIAIQGVIALFDYFSTATNEASDNLSKLAESSVSETASELIFLKSVLDDNTISLQDKADALKDAAEEHEELNSVVRQGNVDMALARDIVGSLITKYMDFAKAKAMMELFNEAVKKQQKILAEGAGFQSMFESYESFFAGLTNALSPTGLDPLEAAFQVSSAKAMEEIKKIEELLKSSSNIDPNKSYYELLYGSNKKDKRKKASAIKDPKEFNKELEDYEKQLRSVAKKEELALAESELEKIQIRRRHHINELNIKHKENEEKFNQQAEAHRKSLELFLEYEVAQGNITQEQSKARLKSFKDYVDQEQRTSKENFAKLLSQYNEYYDTLSLMEQKAGVVGAIAGAAVGVVDGEKESPFKNIIDGLKEVDFYAQQAKAAISGISEFLNSEYDRQMTIEQNKTNAINTELNDRLLNEQLSTDQRKAIQQQIWQNDENLRKKQEQIAKKRFKTNKAFNLSLALIETYLSASKAYASQLIPGDPSSLIRAKIAAGVATATGLMQVAAIARQKFQSSSARTPIRTGAGGGAGGGVGDRSFNFTLAGQTEGNQLVDAIQSQFNNPIRAYVVSGDVTNQQQLDANIQSSASF